MKQYHSFALALLVFSGAYAQDLNTSDANRSRQVVGASKTSVQAKPSKHWPNEHQVTKTKLAELKADMVHDMHNTSVFVQERANEPTSPSRWLIGLAAVGLVMIQLRRKHRSLPLQRITPYG